LIGQNDKTNKGSVAGGPGPSTATSSRPERRLRWMPGGGGPNPRKNWREKRGNRRSRYAMILWSKGRRHLGAIESWNKKSRTTEVVCKNY